MSDKEKALEAFERWLNSPMNSMGAHMMLSRHKDTIRAALQDKPVPYVVDDAGNMMPFITKEKLDRIEFHLNSAQVEIANGLNPSDEIEMALKILKGE